MSNSGVYKFPKPIDKTPASVDLVDTSHEAQMKILPTLNRDTSIWGRVREWFKKYW